MMPFEQAREHVRELGLKTEREYHAWSKTPERQRTIAANPDKTYAAHWAGWPDFLGYPVRKLLTFHTARRLVRALNLRSRKEWVAWTKSGHRPTNIPAKPEYAYGAYWRGFPDWLGYRRAKRYSFFQARRYVRRIGLRTCAEWQAWAKTPSRPRFVPTDPYRAYRSYWQGWSNWLGTS
jgi:hypothetical protein